MQRTAHDPQPRRNPVIGIAAATLGVAAGVAAGIAADRAGKHRAAMAALETPELLDIVPDEEHVVLTSDGVALHCEVDVPDPDAGRRRGRGCHAPGPPRRAADDRPDPWLLPQPALLGLPAARAQGGRLPRRQLGPARARPVGRGGRDSYTIERLGEDLRSVIDQLAPTGDLILVGHSMGGMTMLALGEQHPALILERVSGAAFVATSAGGQSLANGGRVATLGAPRARPARARPCSAP